MEGRGEIVVGTQARNKKVTEKTVGGTAKNAGHRRGAVSRPPQQMMLAMFQEMLAEGQAITDAKQEIGFNKSNVLVDVSDLSMLSRRVVNACHFIAAQSLEDDADSSDLFDVDIEYFKWLTNFSGSRNHGHLKKCLREAQKAAAMVNIYDHDNPKHDRWISAQLVGTTAIANGRVYFRIPEEIRRELANPDAYTFLSLRISNAFSTRYAMELYEKLSQCRYKGGTGWMTIEDFKASIKIGDVKTLSEFKNLRRYVIDPSIEQINRISDIAVSWETRAGGGTRKITHLQFTVTANPNGELNLRLDYRQTLSDLFETLTVEFGLSQENLAEIMEQRESWTDARIMGAVEFTRDRVAKKAGAKDAVKYPGLYLMNAIRKGLMIPDAERVSAQKITPQPRISPLEHAGEKKKQADISNVAADGVALFEEAGPEVQDELFTTFLRSPAYKPLLKGITTIEDALANPRVRASLGAFTMQQLGGKKTER